MSNPLAYLFKSSWKYAEGNRKQVVLFWILFILAGSLNLFLVPFIWAKIFSIVQNDGVTKENISTLTWLIISWIPITVIFWAMHGPARVMEMCNGFKVRLN